MYILVLMYSAAAAATETTRPHTKATLANSSGAAPAIEGEESSRKKGLKP